MVWLTFSHNDTLSSREYNVKKLLGHLDIADMNAKTIWLEQAMCHSLLKHDCMGGWDVRCPGSDSENSELERVLRLVKAHSLDHLGNHLLQRPPPMMTEKKSEKPCFHVICSRTPLFPSVPSILHSPTCQFPEKAVSTSSLRWTLQNHSTTPWKNCRSGSRQL